jgi:hypothetical protein
MLHKRQRRPSVKSSKAMDYRIMSHAGRMYVQCGSERGEKSPLKSHEGIAENLFRPVSSAPGGNCKVKS